VPPLKWRAAYVDTAQKAKEHNDYTVFLHAGMGEDGRVYLLDCVRGKFDAVALEQTARDVWAKWKLAAAYPRAVTSERTPYRTADGYISALVYNDKQWNAFIAAVDPPWAGPEFATLAQRAARIGTVYAHLRETFRGRTTAQWLDLLNSLDIPAAPVNTLDELLDNPQLTATGFFETVETPSGPVRFPGPPTWFSRTPGRVAGPAPRLGEHTPEILCGEDGSPTPAESVRAAWPARAARTGSYPPPGRAAEPGQTPASPAVAGAPELSAAAMCAGPAGSPDPARAAAPPASAGSAETGDPGKTPNLGSVGSSLSPGRTGEKEEGAHAPTEAHTVPADRGERR